MFSGLFSGQMAFVDVLKGQANPTLGQALALGFRLGPGLSLNFWPIYILAELGEVIEA